MKNNYIHYFDNEECENPSALIIESYYTWQRMTSYFSDLFLSSTACY